MIDFIEKMIPFVGYIEPTLRCNHRCFYCYREKVIPAEKDELTRDEIKQVLDDMASLGTFHVVFTGGEIFLRRDIFEIIEDARKRSFSVVLFTNGSLIDVFAADRIKEYAITAVEITLRAARAEVHDEITGMAGSFSKTIDAYKLLQARGVHVNLKCQLHKDNMHETFIKEIQALGESLGTTITCSYLIFGGRDGDLQGAEAHLSGEEMKSVFRNPLFFAEKYWQNPRSRIEKLEERPCGAGINSVVVSSQGEVYPCIPMLNPCGSIRNDSLRNIWHNSPILQNLRSLRYKDFGQCIQCDLKRFCTRCTALVYSELKSLKGCSQICKKNAQMRSDEFNSRIDYVNGKETIHSF